MQIKLGNGMNTDDRRRVDFYGNTTEGIYIQLVDKQGITYFSKRISETERLHLIKVLTSSDNGRAV